MSTSKTNKKKNPLTDYAQEDLVLLNSCLSMAYRLVKDAGAVGPLEYIRRWNERINEAIKIQQENEVPR